MASEQTKALIEEVDIAASGMMNAAVHLSVAEKSYESAKAADAVARFRYKNAMAALRKYLESA